MKRVGHTVKKPRNVRKYEANEVIKAQTVEGKGYATLTDVARGIDMLATTHLLGMLKEMNKEGMIRKMEAIDGHGRNVYRWIALPDNYQDFEGNEVSGTQQYYIHNKDNSLVVLWLEIGGLLVSDNLSHAVPFLTCDKKFARRVAYLLSKGKFALADKMQASEYLEFESAT